MNNTLVFVHVPKTAGSTLHNILNQQYKNVFTIDGLDPQKSIQEFMTFEETKQNDFEVVKGHLVLQLDEYIAQPTFLTYLRDPVDRFLSDYYYVQRATWNRNHEIVKDLGLEEFTDFAIENCLENTQVRHLSNSIYDQPGELSPKMSEHGDDLLAKAKANLDRFKYIFTTKQFDLSLVLLQKDLGWGKKPYYIRQNQTEKRPKVKDIDPLIVKKIEELERFDIEIFDYAKKLNQELLSQYQFEEELKLFKANNEKYQKQQKSFFNRLKRKLFK